MFRKMRRHDKEISREAAEAILQAGEYGVLSTMGDNGYPYGVPLSYSYKNNCIYFHCAREGHKLDNIKNNEKVSFCVVGKTEVLPEDFNTRYQSVIVFGKASELQGQEKHDALVSLLEKYSAGFIEKGLEYIKKDSELAKIIKIEIEHITGKEGK